MHEQAERRIIQSAINHALSGLTGDPLLERRILASEKEQPKMKKRLSLGLILVAAALLVTMTAAVAAERFGLFDLLQDGNVVLAPEAEALFQQPEEQHTLPWEHVSLRVAEFIRNDNTAAILLELTPTDADTLIIPEEWLEAGNIPADGRQLIALRTLTPSLRLPGMADAELLPYSSWNAVRTEDSSLQLIFQLRSGTLSDAAAEPSIRLRFETLPVTLTAGGYTLDKSASAPASIAFTLEATEPPPAQTRRAAGLPLDIPECGIRIDEATLTTTALLSSAKITCTVMDHAVYDNLFQDVLLVCCDENWNILSSGLGGTNTYDTTAADEDAFRRTTHFAPYTGDTLYIRVYNFVSPTPLAQVVIPLE